MSKRRNIVTTVCLFVAKKLVNPNVGTRKLIARTIVMS